MTTTTPSTLSSTLSSSSRSASAPTGDVDHTRKQQNRPGGGGGDGGDGGQLFGGYFNRVDGQKKASSIAISARMLTAQYTTVTRSIRRLLALPTMPALSVPAVSIPRIPTPTVSTPAVPVTPDASKPAVPAAPPVTEKRDAELFIQEKMVLVNEDAFTSSPMSRARLRRFPPSFAAFEEEQSAKSAKSFYVKPTKPQKSYQEPPLQPP